MATKKDRLILKRVQLLDRGYSVSEVHALKTESQIDRALMSERSITALREKEAK